MAEATSPDPVLLFLGMMYRESTLAETAIQDFCTSLHCVVDDRVDALSFSTISSYYDIEMGGEVRKSFLVFKSLIDREELAAIKVLTNKLELQYVDDLGGRQINLDPGYISVDKLVLASAKDFSHRIYIGQGIFAEVTLHFTEKGPRYFSWTYEDYKKEDVQILLQKSRKRLLTLL